MTNREAVLRIGEHCRIHLKAEPESIMITEALNIAIKALEQQEKEKWIPVSERLPEEHEKQNYIFETDTHEIVDAKKYMASPSVLVTVRDYELDTDFTANDKTMDKKWMKFDGDGRYEVIAWKLMPEPYEELNLIEKINEDLSNWPQWKKDAYNEFFVSTHSKKLK